MRLRPGMALLLGGLLSGLAAGQPPADALAPPPRKLAPGAGPDARPAAPPAERMAAPLVGRPLGAAPLTLGEVLESVARHYPLVLAAEQERVVAEGRALASRGAFDLRLGAYDRVINGSYDSHRAGVGLTQATPYLGTSLFGGYRIGAGSYPVYYGERKTAEGGEFRAGMVLPLLRDRAIDARRADVQRAEVDRELAGPSIALQRIDIMRAASRAYWGWVAAGQRYLIAWDVLRIARERDVQLARRVAAGELAPIERVDNQRVIVDREARLVAVGRAYQQAALLLALYLRDDHGAALPPVPERLPAFVAPPGAPAEVDRVADLERAYQQRPELARLSLQRQRLEVDVRLASNQLLPALNVELSGGQDVGAGSKTLDRYTYEAALVLDVPLQRREARGKLLALRGQLAQVTAQEQMARDRILVEVSDALSALERAFDLKEKAEQNLQLARQVEEGERKTFDAGKSDLFRVNIRELTRAEAQFQVIDAVAQWYQALADYQAALGVDPTQAGPPH